MSYPGVMLPELATGQQVSCYWERRGVGTRLCRLARWPHDAAHWLSVLWRRRFGPGRRACHRWPHRVALRGRPGCLESARRSLARRTEPRRHHRGRLGGCRARGRAVRGVSVPAVLSGGAKERCCGCASPLALFRRGYFRVGAAVRRAGERGRASLAWFQRGCRRPRDNGVSGDMVRPGRLGGRSAPSTQTAIRSGKGHT